VEGAQEGVLGDVVGDVVADHARRHAVHDGAVALHERTEGREVAGAGLVHELAVGVHGALQR
jgi:hypothetical protein